jgi:predicted GNAT superfamily acetyltransferase
MIRDMTHRDFDSIIHLNQNALEGVGSLDHESLSLLVKMADRALVVDEGDGDIAGFVITIAPGAEYDSSRYRFFEERLGDRYVYLDRIVVSADHRREGIASLLYEEIESAGVPVALEVYDTNDVSLAFHESRGFAPIGTIEHEGKTNLMLVRQPDASA